MVVILVLSLLWQIEAPATTSIAPPPKLELCRWCFLPAAAHGCANSCPFRQQPSVSMPPVSMPPRPLARTKGDTAKAAYSKQYNSELRALVREAEAKLAAVVEQGLPPHNLPANIAPGGMQHCGGDLVFPDIELVGAKFQGKQPLFVMASGAVAIFLGFNLTHATTEHHSDRRRGCGSHASFAVQTQAGTLHTQGQRRTETHAKLCAMGAHDAVRQWSDAVWLPVLNGEHRELVDGVAQTHLYHNDKKMHSLRWKRIVLYDSSTGEPLVLYDLEGGLAKSDLASARKQFSFLDNYNFNLSRQAGSLGSDPQGEQRMVMLGIRKQGRNEHQLPQDSRPHLVLNNPHGDIDAYVVQHDEPGLFKTVELKGLWNALAARLHSLMPEACASMVEQLEQSGVRERLITADACQTCSDDLLVNNVGVSSRYQSPNHCDKNDVGWTAAFSVKCCYARLISLPQYK